MAPNSNFDFPISLNGDRFRGGDYVLNLTARSGEEEWQWTEEFTIKADEARSLNRDDVTIDSSPNWLLIGSVSCIVLLLAVIVYLIVQTKRTNIAKAQRSDTLNRRLQKLDPQQYASIRMNATLPMVHTVFAETAPETQQVEAEELTLPYDHLLEAPADSAEENPHNPGKKLQRFLNRRKCAGLLAKQRKW